MIDHKIKSKAEIRAEKLLPGNQDFTTITDDIAGVPEQKKTPIQWWLLFGLSLIHISEPRDRSLSRMPSSA